MSFWPFKRKPAPPADWRRWNEDWRIGDTAEVVASVWPDEMPPWVRLAAGDRYTVVGFKEGVGDYTPTLHYFLELEGLPRRYSTTAFRKVRTVSAEQSEVVKRILNAPPVEGPVRKPQDA